MFSDRFTSGVLVYGEGASPSTRAFEGYVRGQCHAVRQHPPNASRRWGSFAVVLQTTWQLNCLLERSLLVRSACDYDWPRWPGYCGWASSSVRSLMCFISLYKEGKGETSKRPRMHNKIYRIFSNRFPEGFFRSQNPKINVFRKNFVDKEWGIREARSNRGQGFTGENTILGSHASFGHSRVRKWFATRFTEWNGPPWQVLLDVNRTLFLLLLIYSNFEDCA